MKIQIARERVKEKAKPLLGGRGTRQWGGGGSGLGAPRVNQEVIKAVISPYDAADMHLAQLRF